ncbi:MAG: bifunctional diaminohydroxyphosphoribosylaminopyrimidine deaminase/5-amino-6-(5-phosphoribosylamino)uracil reductase RibD, partial [Longimicrobiales bacterium]
TLEPCAHHGQTPPCTDAIVRAGLSRVVYAVADPGAGVGGAARLQAAGVTVQAGVLETAARTQNAAFLTAAERRRAWVFLKLAISLDGRIAARAGERTCLSGPEAWADVQRLRAGFDAILIGAGTARADDPLLTVRGDVAPRVPPARVVLDPAATLRLSSRLLATSEEAPVRLFCADDASAERVAALRAAGARVDLVPRARRGLELGDVLDGLWAQGVRSVLCEGGGRVAGSLLRERRIDRLRLYVAPRLLPGGVPAFGDSSQHEDAAPGDAPGGSWRLLESERLGPDVRLTYEPAKER